MRIRGSKARLIKKPSTQYFNRLEPVARERFIEHELDAEFNYKQSIPRKKGKGKYPKKTKF